MSGRRRKRLLVISGIATVVLDATVLLIERHLDGPSILDLEFAGSSAKVAQIASEWGAEGLHYARLQLCGHAGSLAPLGSTCAALKFALIGTAIAYALCGLLVWLWSLRTAGSRSAGVSRSRLRPWR